MQSEFRADTRTEGTAAIIAVSGELDLASSPELERQLERLTDSVVVIDLRGLEFMDSTGLSVIVSAHQRLSNAGRSLSVVKGSPQVQRLLDLTGVSEHLRLVDTPEEALTSD